ncbi:hypothetical protein D1007_38287 [Hordeum vulgare]|nr:hypothetical protein D1007_38287 [Hordeum vulgare]
MGVTGVEEKERGANCDLEEAAVVPKGAGEVVAEEAGVAPAPKRLVEREDGEAAADDAATFGSGFILKADGDYCVSVLDGNVHLAPSDPGDERQERFIFTRFGAPIHDDEGNPAFYLVNKANGLGPLALKNTFGQSQQMVLLLFNQGQASLDESLMWTVASDVGVGFIYIRALNKTNTRLNNDDGGVHDGTAVLVSEGAKGDFQSWKIVSWGREGYVTGGSPGRTVRIVCKAGEGFNSTVRDGAVVLEPTNHRDECQHWFMDMRHGNHVKDAEGYQAFALVNKFTGKAIKPSSQGEGHPDMKIA